MLKDEKDFYKELAWEKVYFPSVSKHMKPKAIAQKNIIKSNLDAYSTIFLCLSPHRLQLLHNI